MKTITQHVQEVIQESIYLEECLKLHIINYSALATHLVPELEKRAGKVVKPGAIMMALRRMQLPNSLGIRRAVDIHLQALGNITLRMNLMDFTFKNSTQIFQSQVNLFTSKDYSEENILSITKGVHEINILANQSSENLIKTAFKSEQLLACQAHLSAISIELPQESSKIKGLYYQLFKRIAWEGISIYEVVSTTNEITLIVQDKYIDRTFSIIKNIKLHQ